MAEWLKLFEPQNMTELVVKLLRIALILLAAGIASLLANRLVRLTRRQVVEVMRRRTDTQEEELDKRARTVGRLLTRLAGILIWSVALLMSLREAGFDVMPLLAGAGIAGVAIGFGAQSLVRDVISGLFLIVENQIRVHDVVRINGVTGTVEEINLRTTVLRGLDGAVHIFPNGTIQTLTNLSREYSFYVADIGVAYKEDVDRVIEVIRQVGEELRQDPEFGPLILEPIQVLGLEQFAESSVVIRSRLKTKPGQQWLVGREFNRRLKKRFEAAGIQIPFPHRTLQLEGVGTRWSSELKREELRQMILDVLAERGLVQPEASASPPKIGDQGTSR